MENEKEKYQNGKIYKIINPEMPKVVYYGSCYRPLKNRMIGHRSSSNKCSSRLLFDFGTPEIVLVENYPCNSKKELERQEGKYQVANQCINIKTSGLTISEQNKKYNDANKHKINKKYNCSCGGKYTHNHKSTHNKTLKHTNFISSKII